MKLFYFNHYRVFHFFSLSRRYRFSCYKTRLLLVLRLGYTRYRYNNEQTTIEHRSVYNVITREKAGHLIEFSQSNLGHRAYSIEHGRWVTWAIRVNCHRLIWIRGLLNFRRGTWVTRLDTRANRMSTYVVTTRHK